jgi:hypothetical protein
MVERRYFRAHFQMRWAPSFKIIQKFYNEFNNDCSVLERNRRRPSSVRSPENSDAVGVEMRRSPSNSTRKAAAQLGISRRSVQRILKSDLNLYPYEMAVLPKLTARNKHQRMALAEWAQNDEVSCNTVWFSDEAHFHLDVWLLNKMSDFGRQRIHVSFSITTENYSVGRQLKPWACRDNSLWRDSEQWALFKHGSQLPAACLLLQTQWFMQDGARPHTANVVLNFLRDIFDSGVIWNRFPNRFACEQNCPPNSPDLNPCNNFLWGFLK